MALTSYDLGLGWGNFPQLLLTHLIPAHRLTRAYLIRLLQGITMSSTLLGYYRSGVLPQEPSKLRITVGYLVTLFTQDRHSALTYKASREAIAAAARIARSLPPVSVAAASQYAPTAHRSPAIDAPTSSG